MITKCPNCGGALEYDVISDRMSCSHCMASFMVGELKMSAERKEAEAMNIQNMQNQYIEQGQSMNPQQQIQYSNPQQQVQYADKQQTDMSDRWMRRDMNGSVYNTASEDMMECNIYTCTACGAELMINGVETSTYCAYCSQPTIVFDRVSMHRRPKLIIPFSITKEQALNIIRNRLNKGPFIPDEIKHFKVDIIRGIYVPYWLVDIDYKDSMIIQGKVKRGDNTVTRYFYRRAESRFTRVPIDASRKFNDMSSERLEPFDYNGCREFNPQYLSGFYSDCSDEQAADVDYKSSFRAKEMFEEEIIKSVSASSRKIIRNNPQFKVNSKTYMMIPVWFMIFRYFGKPYTVMVNGQTGKMVGALPTKKSKVISFFAAFAAVFSILSFIILNSVVFSGNLYFEDSVKLASFCVLGAAVCYSSAWVKLKKYKKSIALTEESRIKHFVSDRQGGM